MIKTKSESTGMKFEACYQDVDTLMIEKYTIMNKNEREARKEAEKIAKMEKKVLLLFRKVE